MSDRVSTQIKCSDCGKVAMVPFKPTANKAVYCRDCLPKHRAARTESSNRIETRHPSQDTEKQAWSRRRESWK